MRDSFIERMRVKFKEKNEMRKVGKEMSHKSEKMVYGEKREKK